MSSLQCICRRNSDHESDSTRISVPARGIHVSLQKSYSIGATVWVLQLAATAGEPRAYRSHSGDHEYWYLLWSLDGTYWHFGELYHLLLNGIIWDMTLWMYIFGGMFYGGFITADYKKTPWFTNHHSSIKLFTSLLCLHQPFTRNGF